jgi:hypothetical protein
MSTGSAFAPTGGGFPGEFEWLDNTSRLNSRPTANDSPHKWNGEECYKSLIDGTSVFSLAHRTPSH